MAENEILQADFRQTLKCVELEGGCDLVCTSPPYDDARTYDNAVSFTFKDYQDLGDGIYAALKPGGHALVVLDGPVREWRKGKGTERSFTPWRVMLDWAERVGFRVPDRMAFARRGQPGRFAGRFRNDWEPLLWFQRPGAKGFFDIWPLASKAKWPLTGRTRKSRRQDGGFDIRQQSGPAISRGLAMRGNLWRYRVGRNNDDSGLVNTGHPARFPLALAEDAVRCFCPPGGIVCDPFVGSGTTAVAAVKHGRIFWGGDLFCNKEAVPWADVAQARMTAALAQCA